MNKGVGIVFLIVGIGLLIWGYNVSQSLGSQLGQVFSGSPSDKAMYLYIGGAACAVLGAFQIFRGGR